MHPKIVEARKALAMQQTAVSVKLVNAKLDLIMDKLGISLPESRAEETLVEGEQAPAEDAASTPKKSKK
jgi:hypothetical protein